MKEETWRRLDQEFAQFPVMRSSTVPRQEVEAAAQALGRNLHEDYAEFLRRYGGAMVGAYPIFGLRQAEVMGEDLWSVVDVTNRFQSEEWPGTLNWYIISMDGSGNPIGIDADGKVWISDHDIGGISLIANTFEDFLLEWGLANA